METASSFAQLNKIIGGGFGIHTEVDKIDFSEIVPFTSDALNTRTVRLINLDSPKMLKTNFWTGQVSRLADGRLEIRWPAQFENALQMCKEYSWIPRIVWGRIGQDILNNVQGIPSSHWYCGKLADWQIYDEFTKDMLRHVTEEWGFNEIQIEVGNEPTGQEHAENNWWMRDITVTTSDIALWPASLEPYINLYKHIATAVNEYRIKHTTKKIKVGGPASGFRTFSADAYPWLQTFLTKILSDGIPIDFVSYHLYRKSAQQGELLVKGLAVLNAIITEHKASVNIIQSEWGASGDNYEENRSPLAAAFCLDILYELEKTTVQSALVLSLARGLEDEPQKFALYYRDADGIYSESPALTGMLALRKLSEGFRYDVVSSTNEVRGFASKRLDSRTMDIIAWGYNSRIAPARFKPDPITDEIVLNISRQDRVFITSDIQYYLLKINGVLSDIPLTFSVADNVLSVHGLKLNKGDYSQLEITFV